MRTRLLHVLILATFAIGSALGQGTVKGRVVDADNGETLPGASVASDDGSLGTVTNMDGTFDLKLSAGDHLLTISYIGYVNKEISIKVGASGKDLGTIELASNTVGLNELAVIASVAKERETPVALSSISPEIIQEKMGTQEFPEILKSTPGIYATRQGGGFGDSRVNVRGFDMRNTAVLINGIPVNDMENGWVYWSNWAGLSDVTRSIQVQRGLGASRLSIGSVGGTINVLTNTADAEKGGTIYTGIGNNGHQKTSFSASTGLMENNWAVTMMGSHQQGQGWADGTWYDGWSYFLNVTKKWDDHILSFTGTGAPQEHGQRRTMQEISDIKDPNKGLRYNPDWGYKNGEQLNLNVNFYHKPMFFMNHAWSISEDATLSTSAYVSLGTGGGTGDYGEENDKFFTYKRENQIDYDRIVDENIANGSAGSSAILRASRNDHKWYGLISNYSHKLTSNITLSGGVDLRYYIADHFREVTNLMGGEFLIDDSDLNNPNKVAKVGDLIGYHNLGYVNWKGLFAQAEYSNGVISGFVSGSFSNTGVRREDKFNYLDSDPDQLSDWHNYNAFVVKGGANYNLNEYHNVFVNAGYFERAPDFDAVFTSYSSNEVNEGVKNEKTVALEAGYGFKSRTFNANINAYYTNWIDKFFSRSFQQPNGEYYRANISGVNALHMGVELDFVWKPVRNLDIRGMASVGDWRWQNDIEDVPIFDDDQNELGRVNLFIKDLKVGDAAQTTAALGVGYTFAKDFRVGFDLNFYDNLYADFDPTGRSNEEDRGVQPWKLPTYSLLDFNIGYNFTIAGLDARVYGNINNVLNTEYIAEGTDGSSHDWDTARVYYGLGRTWSTGIKVHF